MQLCQHENSCCTLPNAAGKLCILLNVICACVLQGECCSQQCIRSTECTRQLLLNRIANVKCKLSGSDTIAKAGNKTSRNIEVPLATMLLVREEADVPCTTRQRSHTVYRSHRKRGGGHLRQLCLVSVLAVP